MKQFFYKKKDPNPQILYADHDVIPAGEGKVNYSALNIHYVNLGPYFSSSTKIAHGLYTTRGIWILIVKPNIWPRKP